VKLFAQLTGFEWDAGNNCKNQKHGVSAAEAEHIFFNKPIIVTPDVAHSPTEPRFRALGSTNEGRRLTVIFTIRSGNTLLRVISARDMHRKERAIYDQEN